MDYYYSQKYHAYAKRVIAAGLTMASHGCVITCHAMILSYFNQRPFYPDQMLDFYQKNGYITPNALVYNSGLEDAAGFKIRFDYQNKPKAGETTYAVRQVYLGNQTHWVLDSPSVVGAIIDSYDGKLKPYKSFVYTGQVRYFFGK